MKFTFQGKEIEVKTAKARDVVAIEKKLGKSLTKVGTDPSFTDIFTVFTIAVCSSDPTINEGWVEEHATFEMMEQMSNVVASFLAIKTD